MMSHKKSILLITSSFFIGSIITLAIIFSIYLSQVGKQISCQNNSIADAVEKVYDEVVSIETYDYSTKKSSGTGFVYQIKNQKAYILTNEHIIKGEDIRIITSKEEILEGNLLGKDAYLDLAIIEVKAKYFKKALTLGKSTETKLGDIVFTIGSPLGSDYRGSVTSGILSGKNRFVETMINDEEKWGMRMLQIDASINPGNSGGPLMNQRGEVIGICTMKLIQNDIEGMSFAIPIEDAIKHMKELEKNNKKKISEIGIEMANINDSSILYSNDITIPEKIKEGVVILETKKESSAEKAKLKKGDIITIVNQTKIKNTTQLKYELYNYDVEDYITITYIRDGKQKHTKLKIDSSKE